MNILQDLLMFFSQTLIIVLAIASILMLIAILVSKIKSLKTFDIDLLNEKHQDYVSALKEVYLNEKELKEEKKRKKQELKKKSTSSVSKPKLFVLDFLKGDIKASATEHLRDEITTLLGVASPQDEVVVRLESPGGLVHGYGLAAAQLLRIRDSNIPLTVCVDQVAASGGYLMACTANKIIAAPFALIGSIGVVAQVPNFNKLLKKYDVDFKEYTAGDYKRTVSLFGEITEKGETKFKEQLEATHDLFKTFVLKNRPNLDIQKVATGEFWYGETALKIGLIDEIKTSDAYLLSKMQSHQIIRISFEQKPSFSDKISTAFSGAISMTLEKIFEQNSSIKKM